MRPVRLEVEGFTSFPARVEVDFRELDLFAITGATGAGKTSLLDAMLYALYGETPRISSHEIRRLISLGANVVKVLLEFEASGKSYRVTRTAKFTKTTTTQIMLEELEVDGEWKSVSGSVKEIGARIPEILGLDFEGFTRSVILPQGEFDKFLRGDPKQRTEILKDLLNLRVYERMMVTANSRAKELIAGSAASQSHLESSFAGATPEILEEQRAQLRTLTSESQTHEKQRARFEELLVVAQDLKQVRESATRATADLAQARKSLEEAISGSDAMQRTLDECERDIALLAATFNETSWAQLLQAVPLAKQQQKLQEQLARRRRERQARAASLSELERLAKETADQLAKVKQTLGRAKEEAIASIDARGHFTKEHGSSDLLRAIHSELEAAERAMATLPSQEHVESAVAQAEQALQHLQTQHAAHEIRQHLKAGDACPVCEQVIKKLPKAGAPGVLDSARKLLQKVRQEHTVWQKHHHALEQARQKAAGRDLVSLLEQARSLDEQATSRSAALEAAQKQEGDATRNAQAAEQRLQLAQHEVASMDTEIKRAQDELREVAASLNQFPDWAPLPLMELEAAMDEQSAARLKLQSLQQRRERALRDSVELQSRRLSMQNRITEKEAEILSGQSRAKAFETDLRAKLPDLAKGMDELVYLQSGLRASNALIQQIRMQIAQTEVHIRDTQTKIEQAATLRQQIEEQRAQAQIYRQLGQLLAADEFIAFIQREALSHLARAASEQLSHLSEGRYTLTIADDRSEREFSVIDHWNADEVRSVNTLSGGESFLASLALALALSEGLAVISDERARTRLSSLFIDEGISSLDAESLDIAIAAISTLSTGKRMVGVISHVAELGERLPARIRVEKSQSGSRVFVESDQHVGRVP